MTSTTTRKRGRVDRRAFLAELARWGGGVATGSAALAALGSFARELLADEGHRVEALDYQSFPDDGLVQCAVCPHRCRLPVGELGFCRTRRNHDGKLLNHAFGNPAILRTDPIEKLPLYHFRPGTRTLSLACGGCNHRCLYCQNWQQSQSEPEALQTWEVPAEKAADGAVEGGLETIAFTYTGTEAWLEYALRIAAHAHRRGVRVVVAAGCYLEPGPMRTFAGAIDGLVAGLKGFDPAFYRDVIGVELRPVQEALVTARETDVWLEVLNLVVPTLNDDRAKLRELAVWVRRELGADTPLHFARFVPEHKLKNLPRTPVETLTQAREIALDVGLKHVYTTNVAPHTGSATYCPRCRMAVIRRVGHRVLEDHRKDGACPKCRTKLPGIWD